MSIFIGLVLIKIQLLNSILKTNIRHFGLALSVVTQSSTKLPTTNYLELPKHALDLQKLE
jgi:hypothetical protein